MFSRRSLSIAGIGGMFAGIASATKASANSAQSGTYITGIEMVSGATGEYGWGEEAQKSVNKAIKQLETHGWVVRGAVQFQVVGNQWMAIITYSTTSQ